MATTSLKNRTRKNTIKDVARLYEARIIETEIEEICKIDEAILVLVEDNIDSLKKYNEDIDYKNFINLYVKSPFRFGRGEYTKFDFHPNENDKYPQFIIKMTNFLYEKAEDINFCKKLADSFDYDYNHISTLFSNILSHLQTDEEDLHQVPQKNRGTGYIFSETGLVPNYSYDRIFWFLVCLGKGGINFNGEFSYTNCDGENKTTLKAIFNRFYKTELDDMLFLIEAEIVKEKIGKFEPVLKIQKMNKI